MGNKIVTYITLPGSDDVFEVTVTYGEDAMIPEGAQLSVTALAKDSDAYASAKDAVVAAKKAEDENFDEYSLGFAALDISILDALGEKVEPAEGAKIEVSIRMLELPEGTDEEKLNDTLEVLHLNESTGNIVVETVAEAEDVIVADGTAYAVFTTDSFSTFPLTWETDMSATIHYGEMDTSTHQFVEFANEKVVTLDTTTSSIELATNIDGKSFIGATYKAAGAEDEVEIRPARIVKKDSGWEITKYIINDDETTTTETVLVENGSDIYVYYGEEHSYEPSPSEVNGPITTKDVSDNEDGTFTITLDLESPVTTEIQQTGANVLIVVDTTSSMRWAMSGQYGRISESDPKRFEVAREAILTLIDTLQCDKNDIDLAIAEFNRTAGTVHNWTKDYTSLRNYVADTNQFKELTYSSSTGGTNWHAGLSSALTVLNNRPDTDNTYVIFLTDGEPNAYGGVNGIRLRTNQNASTAISYAQPVAAQINAVTNTSLYGVFCGGDNGYDNLYDMIEAVGGVETINGTERNTLVNSFKGIAQTIISNLGSSNVSIDDGVTTLSSVSSGVVGKPGGYEYYISYKITDNTYKDLSGTVHTVTRPDSNIWTKEDGTEYYKTVWNDAPGASYSADNGVTWDLSSKGSLPANTIFTVEFKVWPSQEAFDLIANLNNGTVDFDTLDQEIKDQISGNETTGYKLKTNTHLNTTYTFKGNTYTDPISPLPSGDMPLESELMTVKKEFAHDINEQDPYTSIMFYLLVDGKYYQEDGTTSETLDESKVFELPVNGTTNPAWQNSVYIAPGFAEKNADGSLEVLESGHKYSLDERIITGNEYEYEFTPQTVRPMEIEGVLTYLVLVDKYNPAPSGATVYTIDDEEYYVASTGSNGALVGTNRKTAELDITKQIVDHTGNFTEAQLDAETFTYRVTLTVPADGDISGITAYEYVPRWDDAPASNRYTIFGYQYDEGEAVRGIDGDVSRFNGKIYGGYTVTTSTANRQMTDMFTTNTDGTKTATIDITLKRNEIIRFTNLPADTEYTIVEMYNNYRKSDPSSDADAAGSDMAANIADQGYSTTVATKSRNPVTNTARTGSVEGTTVTGTIDYLDVRYYNQFTNTLNDAIDVELTGTKHLDGYEWSGERYYFNLATTNDAPLPIIGANGRVRFYLTEASGTADKSYSFGKIRFTEAGTYTYTIQEDNAGNVQVINEKEVLFGGTETITINVVENEGKLSVESVTNRSGNTVWNAENKVANTTITNAINTQDVTVTKTFSGVTALPNEFQITNSYNSEVFTVANATTGDGTANSPYTWTLANVTVGSNVTFTEENVNVDKYDLVAKVTVAGTEKTLTVSDNKASADPLSVTIGGNNTVAFNNTYTRQTGSLTVSKVTDQTSISQEFKFTVQNSDEKYLQQDGTFGDNAHEFTVTSNAESMTFENLPTDTYTVEEVKGENDANVQVEHYHYNGTTYEPENGEAVVEKNGTPSVVIHNSYTRLAKVTVIKNVVSTLDSDKEIEFSFTQEGLGAEASFKMTGTAQDAQGTVQYPNTKEFPDILYGTQFSVDEEPYDGFGTVKSVKAGNTPLNPNEEGKYTVDADEITVTFTNMRKTGKIEFTKVGEQDYNTTELVPLPDAKFTLYTDPACTTELRLNTDTETQKAGVAESVTDGKVTFTGIPVGTYYMKETGVPTGYVDPAKTYVVTVTDEGTAVPMEYVEGSDPVPLTDSQVVNPKVRAFLLLEKVSSENAETKLADAVFDLYDATYTRENPGTPIATGLTTSSATDDWYGRVEIKVGEVSLPAGRYYLVETKAPDGYNKREFAAMFEIANNGSVYDNYQLAGTVTIGDTTYSKIVVTNSPGYALPSTGGIGTTAFTAGGISLIALALFLLMKKRMAMHD